ncbi:hypothetical protein G6F65_022508 [Rhizopus arrhizus]|nr:hypothetical protein G6F65_022508 [Rhizopus arrhizus]
MTDRDGLQRGEAVQRFEALFTAIAGLARTTERQLHAAAGAESVDVDLAALDAARDALLAPAVLGPDGAQQAVVGGVGQADGVGLGIEGQRHQHGVGLPT